MRRFRVTPSAERGRSIVVGQPDSQSISLGRLSEVGPEKDFRLDIEREHVVAVVGKRGSGKTHTLGVLIESLGVLDSTGVIGSNTSDRAILVFDTLNLFQWIGVPLTSTEGSMSKAQLEKARSWNLPEMSVSPSFWHLAGSEAPQASSAPYRIKVSDMTPQDWGILMDVDTIGDPMGQLLAAAHDKVTRTGWSVLGRHSRPLTNHSVSDLMKCISEDSDINADFAPETRRAVRQRLQGYDRTGLFSTEGTSLADLLKPGEISVLLLARASDDLRTLVVFLLIRQILDQRSLASEATKDSLIRGTTPDIPLIPKTWTFIDEAQNIMPANTASFANRALTRFVREGRNFGLSMGISTQQPNAIDTRVMAQVDVLIAHTLTARQDSNYIQSNLKAPWPDSVLTGRRPVMFQEALRDLEVGQCLVSAVDATRSYFVEVRPRITHHGGFEA